MGHEAQKRMASSSVLLVGLNGLGVEVAKNIILAGVKSVTVLDDKLATWEDLSAQFYLDETSIGRRRAEVTVPKLAELNPYVHVTMETGNVEDVVKKGVYSVVVLVDQSYAVYSAIAEHCRAQGIALIVGDVRGVAGQIFCDFGNEFIVNDADGEAAASSIIATVVPSVNSSLVTVLEESRHNLTTGDVVKITGVTGATDLNERSFQVTVKDPFSFEIDAVCGLGSGGYVNQVKQPVSISFKPLSEAFNQPGEFVTDFVKFDRAPILHLGFRALHEFVSRHGALPTAGHAQHAQEIMDLVLSINSSTLQLDPSAIHAQEKLVKRFASTAAGQLSPVCALMGGVLGQEVLKACSGKFMPIRQWFYYDCFESLPEEELPAEEVAPMGCRYDGQIAVFGRSMQARLGSLRLFLVGAGAIGCEMLKNWSMMGIACGAAGHVHVTDMDQIEKSNLSRQFLFRNADINQLKSTTAVRAVKAMNPSFQATSYEHKAATETEDIFNDDFYESLDMVCTALDNVEARLYLDHKCLFYRKPMLESGTLGTKGHTQVVAPRKTENYGATRDPPEKSIPVCTLKHFPNLIEHTLQWAREWFEEIYKQGPDDANDYMTNTAFLQQLAAQQNMKLDTLKRVKELLVDHKPRSVDDCIVWARHAFEDLFANRIKQLLHNFPLDRVSTTGTPFWSGAKKPPTALAFDPNDPLHVEFVQSVANLRAAVFGLEPCEDQAYIAALGASTAVPMFRPAEGVKIASTDEEAKAESEQQRQSSSANDLDVICDNIVR